MHGPFGWLRRFHEDMRFSARQVRRAPAHAVFTVLVLALGIGTVTAMFTIVYAVLLKPLPFKADRNLYQPDATLPYTEIREWQRATQGTAEIAFNSGGVNIADGPAGAVLITEVEASQNLFPLLGAKPFMGRGFLPEEEEDGHTGVVVLSYALWQQNFGGDRNVLGKTLHIGGNQRTVVGVMPPHFLYPVWENRPQAWVPVERSKLAAANSDWYSYLTPLLRVKAGVPVKDVEAQLARVHAQFAKPGEGRIRLVGVRDWLVGDVRPALLALGAAVCVVWLIACINVAGLLLARVSARRGEIAMRVALGAKRRRIAMQFLTECLVLSCVGAAGGLALAAAMLRSFRHLLSAKLPLGAQIELNWVVWTVLLGLTVVTTLAFGAGPALLAARTEMGVALRSGGARQTRDRAQSRMRGALLVGEVALSVMLLIGAGLMLRTIYALRHVPLGFNVDHLVVTSLTVPNDEYKDRNVGTVVWQPLLDEVRSMPGVRTAAVATVLPIEHPLELVTMVYPTRWMNEDGQVNVRAATPGLMDALGVRMRSGRFFTAEDSAASLPVVVVNRTFVNRYLGGGDGIGKQVRYGHVPRTATVIGVMDDVHQDGVAAASEPELYACMAQLAPGQQIYRPLLGRVMQLAVRTGIPPEILISELRRRIHKTNPHLAIGSTTTMAEAVEDSIGAQKLAAQVIGVFGGLVLLITVVGLYGLLSYQVAQRTQEIGIRMALGADRARVVRMVMHQTLIWLGTGTVIGVAMAAASGRLLQAFLFGVNATDAWVMSLAPAVLVVCGVLAAMAPARRAAAVDPAVALRGE